MRLRTHGLTRERILAANEEPLAVGRVTVLGRCEVVPGDERGAVRASFLEQHPSAATYVEFADFAFYRLEPAALRWVGGFGRMTWVTAGDYRAAATAAVRQS